MRDLIEAELDELLDRDEGELALLYRYHMGFCERDGRRAKPKGKYIRPIICLSICDGLGGDAAKAAPAAAAIELVHRTTLIFDDIQDGGLERNGQPTVHAIWGVNQAINAALALSAFSRLALFELQIAPVTRIKIQQVLENVVLDLCWGQFHDIEFEKSYPGQWEYYEMIAGKSAALFGASCEIGALCSQPERALAARDFGYNLGMIFQMRDDFLGVWGEETGKTLNDLIERKRSLPVVLALEKDPARVKAWLSRKGDVDTMRRWMEKQGIREAMRRLEDGYSKKAAEALDNLALLTPMQKNLEDLLGGQLTRRV